MIKYYFYIFICLFALSACNTEDASTEVPEIDLKWDDLELLGASATMKPFECGDMVTRASWEFNGQKMVFGWETGDAMGLYPTAKIAEIPDEGETWEEKNPSLINYATAEHPLYTDDMQICYVKPEMAQASPFFVRTSVKDSPTVQLYSSDGEFEWDDTTRWTAYRQYNPIYHPNAEPSVTYKAIPIDYTNQTQMGLTDMQPIYQAVGGYPKGYNNPRYLETEAVACKHLAYADFAITPEMVWNQQRINFQFQHVGAIARLFLLAPEADLKIEKVELICDSKIFHVKAEADLTSQVYDGNATHKGVHLIGDENPQVHFTDEATQKVTLYFPQDGSVMTHKPTAENKYLNYLVAYIMLYPIEYKSERDGNLFVYVTAKDENDKEVHFVSAALSDGNLKSGHYYQWTLRTHPDDGLYPIELTATLKPWQEIVGGDIEIGLEK